MARFSLEVGFSTDVGRQRRRNEDDCAVFVPYPGEANPSRLDGLLLVADGMGGERAGDRASRLATERLRQWFATGAYRSWSACSGPRPLESALRHAIQEVSREIFELGEGDPSIRGLGSTVVVALLSGRHMVFAHVGDSRAYRVREGRVQLLTTDHSWVQRQVDAGVITAEAARSHPQRNILTRSLGDSLPPDVDVDRVEVRDGDVFVLCSDGLTGGLEDADLLELATTNEGAQTLAEALVRRANDEDGSDNITAVVGRCHAEDPEPAFEDEPTELLEAAGTDFADEDTRPDGSTVRAAVTFRDAAPGDAPLGPEPATWRTWLTASLVALGLGLLASYLVAA